MNQDIEDLLDKYYNGETTIEEEKYLRSFFLASDIPEHLQSHAAQFRYFAEAGKQQPSSEFLIPAELNSVNEKSGKIRNLTSWSLRIAAGLGLLIMGFASGYIYNYRINKNLDSENNYISNTDTNQPVMKMRKVLAFDKSENTSASDRIQAVSQSYDVSGADAEITELLVNVLNFDVNVNVRLAAFQALLRFESEPGVRQALIQSLSIQTDPNLQIRLIEALVRMKEKRAVEQIERIAKNQEVLDVVRAKAEEGLSFLNQKENPAS
ncbi:HEAT repeat domain-containing protein [Dyadobacter subterraneus]|uniref:HEAT repeat domain-containing protein n=1 Tax=Dyadobacter subterraneus TaxID=2773304 RepID=A0ABR9W8R3_9BACT|nr:HEAT repeat domain-containing protein [Dyadobacter subterraneus]MBE9461862.1 HEAT repeat domain-containing protein [Dyadobacter subterraneus]